MDNQRKVVYESLIEVALLTCIAPLLYWGGGDAVMIIMILAGFNMALNIVAYKYAVKGYLSAQFLSETLEKMKVQQGIVPRRSRFRSWLEKRRR